jgi:hypothetical protein
MIEGRVEVILKNVKTGAEEKFVAEALDYFEIEPYWTHSIRTLESTKWVALLSRRFDEEKPDIHKPN